MKTKQIVRVLEAVKAGCRNTSEVHAVTGIPPKSVSAYLSVLRQDGCIERYETRFVPNGSPRNGTTRTYQYRPIA